jgi:hypothetical protein
MKTFTTIANACKETGLSYLGAINSSAKIIKNKKVNGQYTYIIYLSPAATSGYDVCSHSTIECRMACLATSGRAGMETNMKTKRITEARIKKTRLFIENQQYFMQWLVAEIMKYQAKAQKDGYGFSVRLNGTSDIDWQQIKISGMSIFEIFPEISFYDYTKNGSKFNELPANYHLTFSYSGRNWDICEKLLKKGHNVAMVFNQNKKLALPKSFCGYEIINGDLSDFRIADKRGVIVGLYFKEIGNKINNEIAKKSIFVVQPNDINCQVANVENLSLAF